LIDAGDVDVTVTNQVMGDPLFLIDSTGAGTGDFHLQAGSPAIDAGVDLGVTVDFEGRVRPAGEGFDLGAFEMPATHLVPNEFDTLQAAYAAASPGDIIEFSAAGDYEGDLDLSGKGITLNNTSGEAVRILGRTIISNMDSAGEVYEFNNITFNAQGKSNRSIQIQNAAIDATFNNCTINNWDGEDKYVHGLGMLYDSKVEHEGSITFNDCTFSRNLAAMWGNADVGMVVNFNRCTVDDTNVGFVTVELRSIIATFTDCTFTQSQQSGRFLQYSGGLIMDMTLSFIGCEFDGQNQCNINIARGGGPSGGGWDAYKEVINLKDCYIHDFNEDGVHVSFAEDDEVNIVNCVFENNGRAAIYPTAEKTASGSATINITDSTFVNNARTIYAWYGAYPNRNERGSVVNATGCYMSSTSENLRVFRSPTDWNFTNCVFDGGRRLVFTESPPDGSGEPFPGDRNFTFTHCTMVSTNWGPMMDLRGGVGKTTEVFSKATLQNCILVSFDGDAFGGLPQASVVADNCIIEVGGLINAGEVDVTVTNEVIGDPLFVWDSEGPGTGDFHLQAGSPAVDAGVDVGVMVDFDGIARPFGEGFDLGAFELVLSRLLITDFSYDTAENSVTITWTSNDGKSYSIESSEDLQPQSWIEETDGIPSEGETTTIILTDVPAGVTSLFFRVREE
jgi:hypothetical protein